MPDIRNLRARIDDLRARIDDLIEQHDHAAASLIYMTTAMSDTNKALASLTPMMDSQSPMTNVSTMTAPELNEVIVDLDALFAKFDVGDPLKNERYMKAPTHSKAGVLTGVEAIVEGEPAQPGHVLVSPDGYLTFRFNSPEPDGFGYASFDLINTQLEVMFPGVWRSLSDFLSQEYDATLPQLASAVRNRLREKPQLIELANMAVSNGRMMRASEAMEAEQELKDVGYEADEDYGQF